ncbi:MAG: phosphoribosylaminoimidazolesuccinocarboxamide synthase [Oscillatoriales cyanobacterium SM2_1_8]|nr:phosphoribosylaminoimidazolesuccinocarboxamide synthase [Oscillatoriales cyanobacterium SM2_1_8]
MALKRYEGKAKILYATDDPQVLRVYYKDDATAFNAQKRAEIAGKGALGCRISSLIFAYLQRQGIPSHFLQQVGDREMLVQAVEIIPLEVVVRNVAAGSLCRRLGIGEGTILAEPLVEFYLKNDALGDPLLTDAHIALLGIATPSEKQALESQGLVINRHLQELFGACDLTLVDFKVEFGRDRQGQVLLADEIAPDTCRLWDRRVEGTSTARSLDKDRFRQDLGGLAEAYQEVWQRLRSVIPPSP